jgi:hypothetical protein
MYYMYTPDGTEGMFVCSGSCSQIKRGAALQVDANVSRFKVVLQLQLRYRMHTRDGSREGSTSMRTGNFLNVSSQGMTVRLFRLCRYFKDVLKLPKIICTVT